MRIVSSQISRLLLVTVSLSIAACKGTDSKKVDDALNSDLSLAAQAHPGTALDSVSAAERGLAPAAYANTRSGAAPVHHTYSSSRGSYSGSRASSGTYRRSEPTYRVEKHPGRDAAIGAGAGAVLGAATSKNKVKGGIIGAAAGGILGAIIGNNVDKQKVPQ